MREFFKGWRRKMGLVALAVATMCLSVWIRSHQIADAFSYYPDDGSELTLTLTADAYEWTSRDGIGHAPPLFMSVGWQSY